MAFESANALDVPPFQLQQLVPLVFDFDVPDSGLGMCAFTIDVLFCAKVITQALEDRQVRMLASLM